MRSAVEQFVLSMIQHESAYCEREVGDACLGTLFVDLSFERNVPCSIEDAEGFLSFLAIEHDREDAEQVAKLLTPIVFAPKGTPSYVFLIASLDDAGFVNWQTFATRADLDRAWAKCEEIGQRFECGEC